MRLYISRVVNETAHKSANERANEAGVPLDGVRILRGGQDLIMTCGNSIEQGKKHLVRKLNFVESVAPRTSTNVVGSRGLRRI